MLRWQAKRPREFDAGTDTLHRLLDRELLVASEVAAATTEAERLVAEARAYAIRAEASCETTINERLTSLSASYDEELQRELGRIQSSADLEAARFDDPDSSRTRSLVTLLLESIGAADSMKRAGE
jgi:vacuolar-type H+-ATPase subunit H